jgi:outer membrane immunogenic protein
MLGAFMKRFAIALLAMTVGSIMVFVAQGANAADLPSKAPAYVQPLPAYSWTGFYAGLNIGYGAGRSSLSYSTFSLTPIPPYVVQSADLSVAGVIGGGQIGYNWQLQSNWLVGLEADLQWANQSGSANFSVPAFSSYVTTDQVKLDWFGTVRGRVGFITNGTNLWYATGGWAYGKTELNSSTSLTGAAGTANFSSNKSGWTLGAGVESQIVGNWTAKLEYLYMKLGSISGTYILIPTNLNIATTASADLNDHIVRAGVNYKF